MPVGVLATDLSYWRHSSLLVSVLSVLPVIKETVGTSRFQQVVSDLLDLWRATRIHPGPDPLYSLYGRSLKSDRQLRIVAIYVW